MKLIEEFYNEKVKGPDEPPYSALPEEQKIKITKTLYYQSWVLNRSLNELGKQLAKASNSIKNGFDRKTCICSGCAFTGKSGTKHPKSKVYGIVPEMA